MFKKTVLSLLLVTATTINAQDLSAFSAQADLGQARHKIGTKEDNVSKSSFAPSVALAYQINDNWSARLQYSELGEVEALSVDSFTYSNSTWIDYNVKLLSDASLVGFTAQYQTVQRANHWSFGGRLGAALWQHKFTVNTTITKVSRPQANQMIGTGFSDSGSDSGVGLLAGVFAHYHFTEQLALTFDLDLAPFSSNAIKDMSTFDGFDDTKADYHISRLAVGINYRF